MFTQQTPRVFLVDAAASCGTAGPSTTSSTRRMRMYEAYLEPAIASILSGQPIARPDTASFGCAIQSVYYTIARPLKRLS